MYEVLEDIGLSRNESKVYLALLELGPTTAGPLAKKADIDRTNAYYSLERLSSKGLVSVFFRNKIKYFEATDPDMLKMMISDKEEKLEQILPKLKVARKLSCSSETHVEVGLKALRIILEEFLNYDETILSFGISSKAVEKMRFFEPDFHRKRIDHLVHQKSIYTFELKESDKQAIDLSETRFLPKGFDSVVSTYICGEEVLLVLWQDSPLITRIISRDIAQAYKNYFEILWRYAEV